MTWRGTLVRRVCTPHGNGWYTVCRGRRISRLQGLAIFFGGSQRAKMEYIQTTNPNELPVDG